MRLCYCLGIILINFGYLLGLEVRLWPVNARGNEGFVEVYHDDTWGLIGSPEYRFSDETSALLCKTLGISDFGYSSGWTSIDNYGGVAWTYGLECYGNETVLDQCHFPYKWKLDSYTNKTYWGYRHGTRLFCVDAQITGGPTQNSGLIEASLDGNTYSLCYDGVDMNAANVVCNQLGYDGAISIKRKEPGVYPLYRKKLSCTGCEYSLSECDRSQSLTSKCIFAATVTCKAVRLARMNRYTDEGPVEVFHNGSWGMIGDPGFRFNDETASYLCNRFNLGNVGFGTTGNLLQTYGRKAWLSSLHCLGNETNVMECRHSRFSTVPSIQHTYKRGTWLYCFGFDVTQMRLTGGVYQNEGRVELLINGRWGYIATQGMTHNDTDNAAKVVCREMGYSGQGSVLSDENHGRKHDLFWMSFLKCTGNESSLQQCKFNKGSSPMAYEHPFHLRVRCSGRRVSGYEPHITG
ncbi:scavenger receptor cysteine-rich type 1 protein M130-like isoform X5 [Ruditapes philippinarum]|uniref:scavenger receptor cysteine-rich type 1 protein M130-like isoform X5 n=1 Tax=Ruditapes philippinarum TaxID=129788 RepID=UPI00295C00F2|nr:scavenger receptor cysteine-rich type 1 protein M130-like isoform X5 [Ruditapes philippinarum]